MKILFVVKQKKNVETFAATIRALDRARPFGGAGRAGAQRHPRRSVSRARSIRRGSRWCAAPPIAPTAGREAAPGCCAASATASTISSRRCGTPGSCRRGACRSCARSCASRPTTRRSPRRCASLPAAADRAPRRGVRPGRAAAADRSALRRVPSRAGAGRAAPLAARALRIGAGRLRRQRPRAGIPVGMLLYSWDNLSTKGCLHRPPDWMFVWNERQRAEARRCTSFPRTASSSRARRGSTRSSRCAPPDRARSFTRRSVSIRASRRSSTSARRCSCRRASWRSCAPGSRRSAARPARSASATFSSGRIRTSRCLATTSPSEEITWPSVRGAKGFVARPFDDPRAIVLKTSDRARQGLFECLVHSAAVVGLNTSAELEAAIVGRPVYTVIAGDEDADGQSSTLHFHYLLEEHGGCVRRASDLAEHVAQLQAELERPRDRTTIRRFAGEFLRPHGIDRAGLAALGRSDRAHGSGRATSAGEAPAVVVEAVEDRAASAADAAGDGPLVPLTHPKYELRAAGARPAAIASRHLPAGQGHAAVAVARHRDRRRGLRHRLRSRRLRDARGEISRRGRRRLRARVRGVQSAVRQPAPQRVRRLGLRSRLRWRTSRAWAS